MKEITSKVVKVISIIILCIRSNAVKEYETRIRQIQKKHQKEMEELMEKKEQELMSMKETLSNNALLENKIKQQKDEYKNLLEKSKQIENETSQRISKLSSELCQVKDRLALSEEKNRKMERDISQREKDGYVASSKLKEKEDKVSILSKQVHDLKERDEIITEKYKLQKEEMKKLKGKSIIY